MEVMATLNRYAPWIKWTSISVSALALFFIAHSLPLEQAVHALHGWIGKLGWWEPVVFGLLYVLATVLFVPGVVLTLAAGAFFGVWIGTLIVSVAATTGAALAFLIARYLAREKIAQLTQDRPKFRALDQAVGEGGWKIVALLRLSPAIPFNLQNYLYGLTPIGLWPYLVTSWLAMLPGTFMYVYIGHLTGVAVRGTRERATAEWVALGGGLAATVAVTVYVTYLAKQKLQEEIGSGEREDEVTASQQDTLERRRADAGRWPWGATTAAIVALLTLGAAVHAQLNPDTITGLFSSVFGLPTTPKGT
ncbi:MAG TPA: TVP38/TMEM64 family protein [Candidatus Binatia bacterium]|jgi:uncharacterized membrane protein YdjX (TVP38/TMEM64 family)|nr:TVP38/TMEM64 family protein [Candidatus Binatia bacterium]